MSCATCPNDGSIAALGCPFPQFPLVPDTPVLHHWVAMLPWEKLSNYYDGAAGIVNSFFTGLAGGNPKPAIIYIPSEDNDAVDGISAAEGAALTAHANDLKNFVNCGGAFMA